jgi:long-chain acyl-CoA synthetase
MTAATPFEPCAEPRAEPRAEPTKSLADDFFARAAAQPGHPAILGPRPEPIETYAALAIRVQGLAAALADAGVRPGMNIGLHYPSGAAYIAYTYAIWACGACVTPIPTELAGAEKRLIPRCIALDGIISGQRGHAELLDGAAARVGGELPEQALYLTDTRLREPPPGLADLHPAFIRFTSGTTGAAKGVVLSHATIRARIAAANAVMAIGPEDRVVWLLSMAYHFAVSIVAYLSYGAAIVLPANAFGVSILKAADDHRGTLIYGSPTHYDLMTHDADARLPDSLRLAVVTTARLRPELAERFRARFGRGLNETYGIIEIGLPAINHDGARAHEGSVGRLLPAYTLKLVPTAEADPEASDTPTGEVLLQGPGLLDAYYDPWRPRAEILAARGGWLATGDLGRLDADGYLTLVGRAKDLISVGGMKFFPQEVERVLEQHPGISEACVYGVSHPRDGEQPHADLVLAPAVTAQPDPAALEAHCRELLAPYKVPQRFRIVAALPRTASGKLLRRGERPPAQDGMSAPSARASRHAQARP